MVWLYFMDARHTKSSHAVLPSWLLPKVYLFLRERERETEHEQGRSRERQRETQNPKQPPGSELSAQSLMQGSNPQMSRS